MKRSEIVAKVSAKTGVSKRNVNSVIRYLFVYIFESLFNREMVYFKTIGNFTLQPMKDRKTRNFATGEFMDFPEYYRVRFMPAMKIKKAIRKLEVLPMKTQGKLHNKSF